LNRVHHQQPLIQMHIPDRKGYNFVDINSL